ncbi:MAG: hypothetical protein K6F50_08970 [Kiritimatiellae bacterium]|nr:hypothetical protein [Kiritimatiellia bacterium]
MSEYNPMALPKAALVRALKAAGSRTASIEQVEADVDAGAPVNGDGTMDILAYGAWILKGNLNGD